MGEDRSGVTSSSGKAPYARPVTRRVRTSPGNREVHSRATIESGHSQRLIRHVRDGGNCVEEQYPPTCDDGHDRHGDGSRDAAKQQEDSLRNEGYVWDWATVARKVGLLQVLSSEDADPEAFGALRLLDSERDEIREIVIDAAALKRYGERLARLQAGLAEAAQRHGGLFLTLPPAAPLDEALTSLAAMGVIG